MCDATIEMNVDVDHSIAYQNKDVTTKFFADGLKGKSLKAYGLPHVRIVDILPTNLPAVEANELRMDNLFLLSDDSIAILDYESTYDWEDRVKYVNYVARILKRYQRLGMIHKVKKIRLIIIFTADVDHVDSLVLDVGCMKVYMEAVYLMSIKTMEVLSRIKAKVERKEALTEEELMELIILPLTVKGTDGKQKLLKEAVAVARKLTDEGQKVYVLAGLLTFTDKFIDEDFAKSVREDIKMLKVEKLIFDEGVEVGEKRGEDRFALLTERLLKDSRLEDLFEATTNMEVRETLYNEYGIKGE